MSNGTLAKYKCKVRAVEMMQIADAKNSPCTAAICPRLPLKIAYRLGFNSNASAKRSVIAVKIGRIRVKTRWTKALGEARTVADGDWSKNVAAN
jgi:hypothetical protein